MKKFVLLSAILAMSIVSTYAQGYVRTVDGKNYWTETTIEKLKVLDDVGCDDAHHNIVRIPKSNITLIEFVSEGIVYVNQDKINAIEAPLYAGNIHTFLAEGKRVYIPVATSIIEQRYGSITIRNFVESYGPWQVVGCPEEADFILKYIFNEAGKDSAHLLFVDRAGNNLLISSKEGAMDWEPKDAGIESATRLYKKIIVDMQKSLTKNKTLKRAQRDYTNKARYKYIH